jgi:iron(III) transport system substrate-binding protein
MIRVVIANLALLSLSVVGLCWLTATANAQALLDAAKQEGEIVYYASMNLSEANALIAEFEKRYRPIKVKLNRTGSEKLLTKVLTESRSQKSFADVIQTVEFSMHLLKRRSALGRYIPVANGFYPEDFKEEGYWTTVYYNPYVIGYNTREAPQKNLPKSYQELLDPKWRGKMMMEGTKADWFAGMLQIMGQERGLNYMRELAKQQPVTRDWVSVGLSPAIMVGIGLAAHPPHLNAAKLFLDFVLSREGQILMQAPGRRVARQDLAAQSTKYPAIKMVPVNPALADRLDEYATQLRAIFGH